MREKINLREYGVVIGFLALCVMITIATPAFASHKNILNLLRDRKSTRLNSSHRL